MTSNTRTGSPGPAPGRDATDTTGSSTEAIVVGAAGGVMGAMAGSLVGLGRVGAIAGAANGVISGRRGVYDWSSGRGVAAFVLDSSWSLCNTAAGLAAHVLGVLRSRPEYAPHLSGRRNRHVYGRGFQPRRGFAITLGNVVSGAGDTSRARRVKLVTDHEDVHIWQARGFGPAFPVLYVGWTVGGAIAGALVWLTARRGEPFGKVVESCSYYLNPFEWWAYSRDAHWPPNGLLHGLGYRRPAVRSFASRR